MHTYSLIIVAVTLAIAWASLGLLAFLHLEHRYRLQIIDTTSAARLLRMAMVWPFVLAQFHALRRRDHA